MGDDPPDGGSTILSFHAFPQKISIFPFSSFHVTALPDGQVVSISQSLYIIPDWRCIVHLKIEKTSAGPLCFDGGMEAFSLPVVSAGSGS